MVKKRITKAEALASAKAKATLAAGRVLVAKGMLPLGRERFEMAKIKAAEAKAEWLVLASAPTLANEAEAEATLAEAGRYWLSLAKAAAARTAAARLKPRRLESGSWWPAWPPRNAKRPKWAR